MTIEYFTSPSKTLSLRPVMVTVCAVFQFVLSKASEVRETVPSVLSLLSKSMATVPVGSLAK